jgi:predicted transcriptional regulator
MVWYTYNDTLGDGGDTWCIGGAFITENGVRPTVMNAQTYADPALDHSLVVPDSIDSPEAKLVFVYLQTSTGATVDELHERLDLPRLSLFPVLDTLRTRGLVSRQGETYVAS